MKNYLLLLVLVIFSACGKEKDITKSEKLETTATQQSSEKKTGDILPDGETTTYFFIRHAEKLRTNPDDDNPSLNAAGMNRARNWATYFESTRIDKLYVTKYLRTKQTASPIAQQKLLKKTNYNPDRFDLQKFLDETHGQNVLVVGHSNTIPKLVNSLIGEEKFQDMADDDNSTLFKVTINGKDKKTETIKVE